MTLQAAKLLDQAFETYMAVARQDDSSGLANQSPSWEAPKTPYDFAAELCKSLLPHAYNYPAEDTTRTEVIWDAIVEALEVLPIDTALSLSTSNPFGFTPDNLSRSHLSSQ